jgi:hypothetical protein
VIKKVLARRRALRVQFTRNRRLFAVVRSVDFCTRRREIAKNSAQVGAFQRISAQLTKWCFEHLSASRNNFAHLLTTPRKYPQFAKSADGKTVLTSRT